MATADTYCTHAELKRVYPQIDAFDTKTPIYGWAATATSNLYIAQNTGLVSRLFIDGEDLGNEQATVPDDSGEWWYNETDDELYYKDTSRNPADYLMEAGENFANVVSQICADASRYLDSKLDPNLPREQLKDKSGNYDYMIIRSTALIAAAFMIRSSDPTNEVATALMEEAQGNINSLNEGKAALSWQNTRDASRGIIRDITYTSEKIRPVDTRGTWSGTYDLIKVKIITGGVLGTATYSVWVKDGDKLKNNQVVTAEKINGDYQALAGGLEIRFGGKADDTVATANNEWEVEVMGVSEHVDASGVKSVKNSRWLG